MTPRSKYDLRTLIDGHATLRNFLGQVPASGIPNEMMIKFAKADRQLREVDEIVTQRKAAFAREYGVETSADGGRYIPSEDDGGEESFAKFQAEVSDFLATSYPIEFEQIPWDEAASQIRGLTGLHFVLMPFLFSVPD